MLHVLQCGYLLGDDALEKSKDLLRSSLRSHIVQCKWICTKIILTAAHYVHLKTYSNYCSKYQYFILPHI